jgi:hypothetical protein
VVDDFIYKQLEHNFLPLRPVIKSVIENIRARDGKGPLSEVWFGKWWTSRGLHKIKTKPIAIVRITAQDEKEVDEWYEKPDGYFDTLSKFQIKDMNIYNFDETNARLGCPRGMDVIVPEDVKELYSLSPENRKSVTVIETIGCMNVKKIPPVIIVPGAVHMESWYRNQTLTGGELVLLSSTGFTNDQLALEYLMHFIKHVGAGPDSPDWILLLCDNHGSHRTPQFILLAYRNKVIVLTFISHLTHSMQPLDVGSFGTWKHYQNAAINISLSHLEFTYDVTSFFRDLAWIRHQTFKVGLIRRSFRESGMVPPDPEKVKQNMRKYYKMPKEVATPIDDIGTKLPSLTRINQSLRHIAYKATLGPLSSPTRHLLNVTAKETSTALHQGEVARVHADNLTRRVQEITTRKPHNRKRIQNGGRMNVEDAQAIIDKKDKEKAKKEATAQQKNINSIKRKEEKALHRAGVIARRCERLRKEVLENGDILPDDRGIAHFMDVIIDPEAVWLFETAQPMTLPSSPPIITQDSWLDDDIVPLNQPGSIASASEVESSSEDEEHL